MKHDIAMTFTLRVDPKPTPSKSKASIRMQIYLTQEQRKWLKRKAYEEDSKMSIILRDLIDQARLTKGG